MYEKIAILQLPSRIGSAHSRASGRDTDSANYTKHELTAPAPRPPRTPLSLSAVRVRWGLGHRLLCLCVDSRVNMDAGRDREITD